MNRRKQLKKEVVVKINLISFLYSLSLSIPLDQKSILPKADKKKKK